MTRERAVGGGGGGVRGDRLRQVDGTAGRGGAVLEPLFKERRMRESPHVATER